MTEPTPETGNNPPPQWYDRATKTWQQGTSQIARHLPFQQWEQWFSVSDERVAEILATIRAELPTTEAILIGKPQSGKSSIVRGLTGVSAEIIGQGFRPHTQSTQRYNYPNQDLPLLIFTDTVGLGDVERDTQSIIDDLTTDFDGDNRARVIILTVKINDFATDTLRQIAKTLREKYPQVPCLLAVTCLHQVYPSNAIEHPTYPPDLPELNRAYTAIQTDFKGLFDRSVLIDFTLEEDGFDPVFYGLDEFRDRLIDLLPSAESNTIHQLIDRSTSDRLGHLYRDVARRYILAFTVAAGAVAAIPFPFADMPVLTAVQVSMTILLGKLYGQNLSPSQAGGIVSTIAGGFVAQAIARELLKLIPGFGSAVSASWAAAYTFALGEGACVYFGDLMGGKKPDPEQIQSVMSAAFQSAKERIKQGVGYNNTIESAIEIAASDVKSAAD
jgi:uncharacterized protein (DUF697 family)/GTP-binding protein EngB required for normal cell division